MAMKIVVIPKPATVVVAAVGMVLVREMEKVALVIEMIPVIKTNKTKPSEDCWKLTLSLQSI